MASADGASGSREARIIKPALRCGTGAPFAAPLGVAESPNSTAATSSTSPVTRFGREVELVAGAPDVGARGGNLEGAGARGRDVSCLLDLRDVTRLIEQRQETALLHGDRHRANRLHQGSIGNALSVHEAEVVALVGPCPSP